ncbi:MAG: AraC family transcriptional regulator [Muricauda sp.]|nr:AraC family transcriptional regulator [Allomuricauda sp.]MAU26135.1 AraC family transcriptional regulator [Allomuricauda sp.]MBC30915.1 AraC family transcriptional regulator [Allomuricauda sp.]|tara:strand:- start:211 stop:1056 length:846 start_codon:yes stop_codon:yes gene_type:complete
MKVYPFRIPKRPEENLLVQEDVAPKFYDKLHQHEEIQVSHIISGSGKLVAGNYVGGFEAGETFVIGSHVPHLFQSAASEEASHMISLFFKPDIYHNIFEQPELKALKPFFNNAQLGFKVIGAGYAFDGIFTTLTLLDRFDLFLQFFTLLKQLDQADKLIMGGVGHHKKITDEQGLRLQKIFDFTMNHFLDDIRLEDVAAQIHMTKNAFCRYFKQRTQKTYFQFLIELRIEHACQLLANNGDLTIADAAFASGFNCITNFNRKFKAIKGQTPSDFLKGFRAA